jgi:hypothetical protein
MVLKGASALQVSLRERIGAGANRSQALEKPPALYSCGVRIYAISPSTLPVHALGYWDTMYEL